mgnify:CR=1 FL=1
MPQLKLINEKFKDRSGNQKIDRKVFHWENYRPDRCNYRKSEIAIPVHPRKRWSDKGYADDELHSVWRHGRTCSVCPSAPMSGFGHAACRNGRKRTPGRDSPCAKVQAQESENPFTHVRDCRGKPDPKGNAPNNRPQKLLLSIPWKKEDRIFRSFVLMIYICNWAKIIAENVKNYMLLE